MKIKALPNGPNMVETYEPCSCSINGAEKALKSPFYLCRCGQSKNKPFCDFTLGSTFPGVRRGNFNEEEPIAGIPIATIRYRKNDVYRPF